MSEPAWNIDRQRSQPSFKVPPLRLPGQSIDEQINALQDKIGELFLTPLVFVAVSSYGWIQWWTGRPANPLILSIVAIITILYAGTRISSIQATIRNLQVGRDGERLVGQMLEQLRAKGYRVFHDIPGPSFNIDHAIVGPAGIFTIETNHEPSRWVAVVRCSTMAMLTDSRQAGSEPTVASGAGTSQVAYRFNESRQHREILRSACIGVSRMVRGADRVSQ